MLGNINKGNWLSYVMTLLVCVLCLWTSYRYTSFIIEILALLILLGGFWMQKNKYLLSSNEKLFVYAMLGFFASALLSFIVGKGWELQSIRNPSMPSLIDLDLPSKFVVGAVVFILFLKSSFKIYKPTVFYAIGLGGMLNGGIAIYERYVLGHGRIDGFSGIAEMADASAILCLFSLILLFFSSSVKERFFYSFSATLACIAVILTGTRGAMLGVVVGLVFLGLMFFIYYKERFKKIGLVILVAVMSFGFVAMFSGGIKDPLRLQVTGSDIAKYAEGNFETSIGARFEMWKEAVAMFKMAPIFGLTTVEIKERLLEILQKSGSRIVRDQTHQQAIGKKHNQFLNQAAKRGIVGLLALLFVWFASFKLFVSELKNQNPTIFMLSLLPITMLVYFIFPNSFTGEPWESNVSFPLMTLFICVFYKMRLEVKTTYA